MSWLRAPIGWSSTLAWIAIGWIVVFWRLGYASLLDPDEAHYAELTREMLHSGNWLVPLLDGKPFIDKPVLFHWLQGASVLLLGETEFAARLPTALSAVGLFAVTRWVGTALFDEEIGSLGAVKFATNPATSHSPHRHLRHGVRAVSVRGSGCLLVAAKRFGGPNRMDRLCAADACGRRKAGGVALAGPFVAAMMASRDENPGATAPLEAGLPVAKPPAGSQDAVAVMTNSSAGYLGRQPGM